MKITQGKIATIRSGEVEFIAGRSQAAVWNVTPCAGVVQSRAAWGKKGFRRRRTAGETISSPRIDTELCARAEQRLWRAVTRKKYQLRRDLVRLNNQLESLLEETHIKLSSLVSDLLGVSARRMLKALADGETNPAALAALAHQKLRATPEQLCAALGACADLKPV
jgi:hypothetical protein